MRLLGLAAILCASSVQGAAAQTGDRWLIVPVATSADSWVEPTTSRLYDELAARGVGVWAPGSAAKRFEVAGSSPAPMMTDADIRQWLERSNAVLESLVQGNPAGAHKHLRETELLSLATVAALNRDSRLAQKVFDTCLLGVRALLEVQSSVQAEAMASECRQLSVTGEPTPYMHPPPVVEMLTRLDAERAERTAVLQIRSEPSQCAVRVNGAILGETPLDVPHLLPGDYAVQVECDAAQRGRTHHANVAAGNAEIFVDARFDATIVTQPTLALRYADAIEADQYRNGDAGDLATVVPAAVIVLMSTPDTATIEVELRRGPTHDKAAFARIKGSPAGPTRGDIALVARTLIDGKCVDMTTLPPVALPCGTEPLSSGDGRPIARMPRGKFISGMTFVGVGSAGLIAGYVLFAPRSRASEDWVRALDAGQGGAAFQQKWINMGIGLVVTSSAGAAALVTAMPLALPKKVKTPWWAWLSGGLGFGFAAFSVAYGVTAESEPGTSCNNLVTDPDDARTCVRRSERVSAAILTGATAAPLLTIPLVYLLRPAKSKLAPEVEVGRSGAYLGVRGEF
ncbi:MAG: PEGA domain-containing protein [Deltaproteobacteria bacterium]|nr:PEGA domain-containing protein [Deltaproteobacteria bacterium]MBW2404363.1 PEGA domain-containing protein [Deltaproteobacteria bacterium]